ncbi:hypothetical protein BGW39_007732 [Mortierella sp. 14UC]|nr:hypothetical protein BGW39_007732 [Mortierella sp. 14UC]
MDRTNTSTPKSIAPGVTRYEFEVQLDPELPPTVEGRKGWFHYRFKAFMQRDFPYRNMAVKQLVWVYSSELRAGQVEAGVRELNFYKTVVWNDVLPVTCSISPTNVLYQGQVVPLTIQVDPFLENSTHKGQKLTVVSAVIKLKQYTIVRDPRMLNKRRRDKKAVVVLPVMDGWPVTSEGFERVVMVTLPGAKQLAASIDSVPVTKTHILKLIMMVRTSLMGEELEVKELRVEMDVKVTSPRPEHIKGIAPEYSSLPPPYQANDSEDGEEGDDDTMPTEFSHSSTSQSGFQQQDVKSPDGL